MSQRNSGPPPSRIRGFFRGLGELAQFLKASALAVLEVAFGRWPRAFGARSRTKRHKAIHSPVRAGHSPHGHRYPPAAPK